MGWFHDNIRFPCSDDVLELSIMPKDEDILQLVSLPGGYQGLG